jgi:hypothetical protein
MNQNARLGHVVIEGHASEEGTYIYNYDLSIRRARSIWEEIIRSGVHPARLSYRGMGEVDPRKKGTDEAALAKNRRVDFHIIHRYSELDVLPEYPNNIRLPWSGQPAQVKTPEDIERKMQEDMMRQRRQRDLEGLQQEAASEPVPVPVPPPVDDEPVERMDESDDEAAPEDPSEDPVEPESAEIPPPPTGADEGAGEAETTETEAKATGNVDVPPPPVAPADAPESDSASGGAQE